MSRGRLSLPCAFTNFFACTSRDLRPGGWDSEFVRFIVAVVEVHARVGGNQDKVVAADVVAGGGRGDYQHRCQAEERDLANIVLSQDEPENEQGEKKKDIGTSKRGKPGDDAGEGIQPWAVAFVDCD